MAYHDWVRIAGIDAPCACFGGLRPPPALVCAILSLMLASSIAMVEREGRR